ncbi:hypothetical protein SACS_0976 [Parasaccharibacter apium]|uniref:Uncharacterized protein n=1 Tax=Parasaccharibacter apium TaxID=1510841 RepID=A0A7U7G5S3_9PROT|nr:hypothetical protein SACS_0976 [Parasaccharibacter apium]
MIISALSRSVCPAFHHPTEHSSINLGTRQLLTGKQAATQDVT